MCACVSVRVSVRVLTDCQHGEADVGRMRERVAAHEVYRVCGFVKGESLPFERWRHC